MYFPSTVTSCDFSSNGLYIACTVDITNTALIYDSRTYGLVEEGLIAVILKSFEA